MQNNYKIKVLYVDDEENNLISFKANYRNDFEITTAKSAYEGLQILENQFIDVVVSDQKMPNVTGVAFLEKVLNLYPETQRVLLTAYSDLTALKDAINRAQIYRFIDKPWEDKEIVSAIKSAYQLSKTQQNLRQSNKDLAKAYAELDKFVYSSSHDLRAPIASILGIVEVAKMDIKDQEAIQYIQLIEKSAKKLDEFVQNIISYYKNSRLDLQLKWLNLNDLIFEIISSFRYYFGAEEVSFHVNIPLNMTICTDELKIKMVLNNLISNAIKYQKKNNQDKRVEIYAYSLDEHFYIEIKDNGEGIHENYINNIFDMFFRINTVNSGSGIGLYIVKEAILILGGDIQVQSTQGAGTTFKIQLPNSIK